MEEFEPVSTRVLGLPLPSGEDMSERITRALVVVCVSLQLLVIATWAPSIDLMFGAVGGGLGHEQRLALAQANIVLMVVASISTLVAGIWLAYVLFPMLRRLDEPVTIAGDGVRVTRARKQVVVVLSPRRSSEERADNLEGAGERPYVFH